MSATPAVLEPAHTPIWRQSVLDGDGSKNMTTADALAASGLDWTVKKVPLFTDFGENQPQIEVKGRYGVQRQTDGVVFGTVGKTWQPTQNAEGFKLVDDLMAIAGNDMPIWIEQAMALQDGRKVIIMVRLDLGLQIAGERYHSYLSFVNGHDGRCSVMAMTHDIRYVCSNGQIGALMNGYRMANAKSLAAKHTNVVRVRHTKYASSRIKEAVQILGMRNEQAEALARQGEWLCEQTISDGDFATFLESLLPIKEDDTPAATMVGARRAAIWDVYFDAPNLAPIRGTRWGAMQAVLEYSDHGRTFSNPDTAARAQLGLSANPLKQNAALILSQKKLKPLAA